MTASPTTISTPSTADESTWDLAAQFLAQLRVHQEAPLSTVVRLRPVRPATRVDALRYGSAA